MIVQLSCGTKPSFIRQKSGACNLYRTFPFEAKCPQFGSKNSVSEWDKFILASSQQRLNQFWPYKAYYYTFGPRIDKLKKLKIRYKINYSRYREIENFIISSQSAILKPSKDRMTFVRCKSLFAEYVHLISNPTKKARTLNFKAITKYDAKFQLNLVKY